MQHRLSIALVDLFKTHGVPISDDVEAICRILDNIAIKARNANEASRGKAGPKKKPIDSAAIKKLFGKGVSAVALAERFGVSEGTIRRRLNE